MDPASGADTARLLEEQDSESNAHLTSSDGVQSSRETNEGAPLRSPADKQWSPYKRDLHMLSFSFLLVFSAFGATQNLESSLNTDQGLGPISMGVLYCFLTVCSFLAPLFVHWLGAKNALLLGLTGYWAFVAANLVPTWFTLVPASAYLGFTASILWVAEGTYLTSAARAHSASCGSPEESTIGEFNGVFWAVFASNQVVGNLLALFLLRNGRSDPAHPGHVDKFATTLLFAVFLACMSVGTVAACFLRPEAKGARDLGADDPPVSIRSNLRSTMALLGDRRLLLLLALMVYSGLQQAFIWSDFTKDVVTPALGVSWVGGVMAVFGASDALASYFAGKLSSGMHSITFLVSGGAAAQLLVLIALLVKSSFGSSSTDYASLFTAAFLWGLGDAVFNTQISAILGICFPDDTASGFAQWKIWQSAATSAACFATPYLGIGTKLCILAGVLTVGMGGFLLVTLSTRRLAVPKER
ncbi:unc-93 homolog A [Klebsormidium nitens]|uniref:Unc-93 homolog A n=1 Tax=Klebsormidium nitens TaxID=105231 RepID=A0A1Y1HQ40_KLENI|nr:unc-93 homolog A [Klebsormidium nitens]|eukprot:GAQ79101.1 unc-93 homolog A [Klebsormidium nitens]